MRDQKHFKVLDDIINPSQTIKEEDTTIKETTEKSVMPGFNKRNTKAPEDRHSKKITFTLTESFFNEITKEARKRGLPTNAFITFALNELIHKEK